MKQVPINKQAITTRLVEIDKSYQKLKAFQELSLEEFKEGENFAIAEHYLRRALEAILEIGSHILSRIPGAKPQSYKDIPRLLGENNIIPSDFANKELKEMSGYRNRLVHFYKEIITDEMYSIIQEDLEDVARFLHYLSLVLKDPQQYGLKTD